jgi:iron complex outermembrane recepter protein
MKRASVVIVAALLCHAADGPDSVSGRLFDPAHAAIPDARIRVGEFTAVSNGEGRYSVGKLAPGDYVLTVTAAGFSDYSTQLEVRPGGVRRDITLSIAPHGTKLLVTAKAPVAESSAESWTDNVHATIDAREVRESGARDAGEALGSLEGLGKVRKGGIANDVLLRGLGHDNINILVDGERIYGACPSSMDPRAFHVDFAEVQRVEVTKGAFDLRNQGSLGGTVDIVTKEAESGLRITPAFNAGSFGFWNPSITSSYSKEKVWGMAGYSYRVSRPYRDGAGRAFTDLTNYATGAADADAFRIHTGWFRLGGEPKPGQRVKLSYTRQESGETLYPYLMMDAGYDNADRLAVSWEAARPGPIGHIQVEGYATRVKHWMTDEMRTSAAGAPLGFSMGSFAESAMAGGKVRIESGGLSVGIEAYRRKWDGTSSNRTMGVYVAQHYIPAPASNISGSYVEYQHQFRSRLRLTGAVRLDWAGTGVHALDAASGLYWAYKQTRSLSASDWMPSASLWTAYTAGRLELFAGVGSTVRVPDPVERYVASKRMGSDFVGNPDLRPSRNTETDAGVTWRARWFLLRPTVFYSALEDFITVHNQVRIEAPAPMANTVARSFANVNARSYGGELSYSLPVSRAILVSGGLSFTRNLKDVAPQLRIFNREVAEIPPMRSRTSVRYGTRLLFLETTFTAVAAQHHVDTDLLESPTGGYGVLDFKGGVHARKWNFAFGLANALDRLYYEHCSYQRDPFRSGARVPEPGRNVFVTLQYAF